VFVFCEVVIYGSAKFYYQTANETANVFARFGEIRESKPIDFIVLLKHKKAAMAAF
jgi:hypothetical protein